MNDALPLTGASTARDNLITDAWIATDVGACTPVDALLRASRPCWGRGDWDAATQVLLIALLQTAIAQHPARCPDEDAWEDMLATPPSDLGAWVLPYAPEFFDAFEMPVSGGEPVPVSAVLPEAPGDSTVTTKAADIAVWKESVPASLSISEARIALYADALWGTRMGRGHRQGIRGEGRSLTMVEPETVGTLWQRVWLNVLPANRWARRFPPVASSPIFPWTAPLRTTATPADSDPLLAYWAMPRRLRFIVSDGRVTGFQRQPEGTDYPKESWTHPLTPYQVTKEKTIIPGRITPGHVGYGQWAGIATLGREGCMPATVVNEFIERRWASGALRLRVCGISIIGSGEIGTFTEATVPLMPDVDPALVQTMLSAAEQQCKKLDNALSDLRMPRSGDRLYAETESEWYTRLRSRDGDGWDASLRKAALRIFDLASDAHRDLVAVTRARRRV